MIIVTGKMIGSNANRTAFFMNFGLKMTNDSIPVIVNYSLTQFGACSFSEDLTRRSVEWDKSNVDQKVSRRHLEITT